MQIKLLTSRAGIDPDGSSYSQNYGDVVEVPDEEGARMIEAGQGLPMGKTPMPSDRRAGTSPEKAVAVATDRGAKG